MNVLIIEDDPQVSRFIAEGLRQAGHTCIECSSGKEGLTEAISGSLDAIICDRMLPDMDGLSIPSCLRTAGIETPVLMLTALTEVEQRVEGLQAGADDYLCKPFAFSELLARLESQVRRQKPEKRQDRLRVADLEVHRMKRTVSRGGQSINLQPREFRLLEYLLVNAGNVVTRTMLLEHVWDLHFDPQTNVVDVHISRLRQKVDSGHSLKLIKTVRGAGYVINDVG